MYGRGPPEPARSLRLRRPFRLAVIPRPLRSRRGLLSRPRPGHCGLGFDLVRVRGERPIPAHDREAGPNLAGQSGEEVGVLLTAYQIGSVTVTPGRALQRNRRPAEGGPRGRRRNQPPRLVAEIPPPVPGPWSQPPGGDPGVSAADRRPQLGRTEPPSLAGRLREGSAVGRACRCAEHRRVGGGWRHSAGRSHCRVHRAGDAGCPRVGAAQRLRASCVLRSCAVGVEGLSAGCVWRLRDCCVGRLCVGRGQADRALIGSRVVGRIGRLRARDLLTGEA